MSESQAPPTSDAPMDVLVKSDNGTLTLDDCASALTILQSRKRAMEELTALVHDAILRHLEATGQDIVIGDIRYYAGHRAVTKCVDVQGVLEVLFTVTVGEIPTNIGEIAACLSSDPYKKTEIKLLLGGRLPDGAFVTEQRPRLLEGKPKKVLLSTNERFTKGTGRVVASTVKEGGTDADPS